MRTPFSKLLSPKSPVKSIVAAGMLLVATASVQAQDYPRYDNRDHRYSDDGRNYEGRSYNGEYRENYGGGQRRWETRIFERTRNDLDRALSNTFWSGSERSRLAHARDELYEFQGKLSRGNFSRHELDDSIGSLRNVLNHRGLNYPDQAALAGDLRELEQFRSANSSGGRYGYGR